MKSPHYSGIVTNPQHQILVNMTSQLVFISKNYEAQYGASGKAKIDCEEVLQKTGFENIGLQRTTYKNKLLHFFYTLVGVILGLIRLKPKSILVLQYPTKKYYKLLVKVAKLKRCKTITIIHDLRSHRKGKVSVSEEIKTLNESDVIISHNSKMTNWLKLNGLRTITVDLEIFDYLSAIENDFHVKLSDNPTYSLIFAGVLEKRKNGFLYHADNMKPQNFRLNLYGVGFKPSDIGENSVIDYQGFFPADQIIKHLRGNFGIVWDGISIEECAGNFGEYLKINNPHKTSMYLRAGIPIIVWKEAAISQFVLAQKVGLAVSSLRELDTLLADLSNEDYAKMKENAKLLSKQLGEGYFLNKAIKEAINCIEP